jgi:hypothetical protein
MAQMRLVMCGTFNVRNVDHRPGMSHATGWLKTSPKDLMFLFRTLNLSCWGCAEDLRIIQTLVEHAQDCLRERWAYALFCSSSAASSVSLPCLVLPCFARQQCCHVCVCISLSQHVPHTTACCNGCQAAHAMKCAAMKSWITDPSTGTS